MPVKRTTIGVVVLHSYGHTDTEPVREGWTAAADRYGFVTLYPYRDSSWNAGLCCGSAVAEQRDDVAWLAATITSAVRRYGLTAVYLAGVSNGAMMAERLVAERPEISSRFVSWGGAPELPSPGRWSGIGVLYSGALDQTVPPAGGTRTIGGRFTVIRPGSATQTWLPSARLQSVVVPGGTHIPPSNWAVLAWRALTAPSGRAPPS